MAAQESKYKEQEMFGGMDNFALFMPQEATPEEVVLHWQTRYHREYLDKHLNFHTTEKKEPGYQFEFPF